MAGYLGIWAAATGRIRRAYWQEILFVMVATNAGAWFDTSALVTTVSNFPGARGKVVGVLKSFVGLSSAVFTAQYSGFFAPSADAFLLYLAVSITVVAPALGVLLNRVPLPIANAPRTPLRWATLYCCVLLTSAYLATNSVVGNVVDESKATKRALTLTLLALLAPAVAVVIGTGPLVYKVDVDPEDSLKALGPGDSAEYEYEASELAQPLLDSDAEEGGLSQGGSSSAPFAERGLSACLRSADYWLLFATCAVGMGSGLVLNNNIAQIVQALGGPADGQDVFVSLYSVGNCVGRLLGGVGSQWLLQRHGVPRPACLVAAVTLCVPVNLALAFFPSLGVLYPAALLAGTSFGGFWGVMPACTSEIFGLKSFASNYSFLQLAAAIGSYGMAMQLASRTYDAAPSDPSPPMAPPPSPGPAGAPVCYGDECFRVAFLVAAALTLVGVVTGAALTRLTRGGYAALRGKALS